MIYESIQLTVPGADGPAELVVYAPGNFPEMGISRTRPGIIICPGGGYEFLSDREGEPVALRFAGMGYAAFVLYYHVTPQGRWPVPQRQVAAAIDYVRANCGRYHVKPHAIVTLGFSAGGHAAASGALLWNDPEVYEALGKEPEAYRPDGAVLCYPVVTGGPLAHRGSFVNLLGDRYDELLEKASLETRVTSETPPLFLWHTADDTCVPVENSLLLAEACTKAGVEAEVHLYPHGSHGQSLADRTVYAPGQTRTMSSLCAAWVQRCDEWLQRHFGDDAVPPVEFREEKVEKPVPGKTKDTASQEDKKND